MPRAEVGHRRRGSHRPQRPRRRRSSPRRRSRGPSERPALRPGARPPVRGDRRERRRRRSVAAEGRRRSLDGQRVRRERAGRGRREGWRGRRLRHQTVADQQRPRVWRSPSARWAPPRPDDRPTLGACQRLQEDHPPQEPARRWVRSRRSERSRRSASGRPGGFAARRLGGEPPEVVRPVVEQRDGRQRDERWDGSTGLAVRLHGGQ